MSYGVKYRLYYQDLLKVNKRIDILEDGYTGGITSVKGSPNPVVWAVMPDSDTKYPLMVASSCDLFLLSPYRRYFINLFTSNKYKYKVQHYIGSTLSWTGYLLPDLYSEAYDRKNYEVNFKAADGLGLLANIDFELTGTQTDLDILLYCLNKLNLELDIYTAVNIFETTMDMDADDDPLAQAYTDCAILEDKDCAEVIREILKPYGAYLYQENNAWHIVRFSQLIGSYTRRRYDFEGTFIESETYDPTVSLTNDKAAAENRNVMLMGATRLVIVPGAKEINIDHDYGLVDNLLPGGNMHISEFTLTAGRYVSDHWVRQSGSTTVVWGSVLDQKKGQFYISVSGVEPVIGGSGEVMRTSVALLPDTKRIVVKIKFRLYAHHRDTGFRDLNANVDFMILAAKSSGNWYLTRDGWRDDSPAVDESFVRFENHPTSRSFEEIVIEGDGLPTDHDDTLHIIAYKIMDDMSVPPLVTMRVDISEVNVMLYPTDEIPLDSEIEFKTIVDEDNNYKPEKITILAADVPDTVNNTSLYDNKKTLADGTATNLWTEPGSGVNENLIVSLARIVSDQYLRPTAMYEALIRDAHIKFGNVIYDIFDGLKYRILEISSYSDALCDMNVKLVEIIEDDKKITTEEEDDIQTEEEEEIYIE